MRSLLYFLIFSYAITPLAQETFVPVCDRTPEVRFALEQLTSRDCNDIGREQLERIRGVGTFLSIRLNDIQPGDFSGLKNLRELIIGGPGLSSVEPEDFSGLDGLFTLRVSRSQLSSLDRGDFSRLPNLRQLILTENQIQSISHDDFVGLEELRSLSLSGNQIGSIRGEVFRGLSQLQTLSLSDNPIRSIEPSDFSGLTSLLTLSIQDCEITSIEHGDFSPLVNLRTLHISANRISQVDATDFVELTKLRLLNVRGNPLRAVNFGQQLRPSLMFLNMEGHSMTSLTPGSLDALTGLRELLIGSTSLQHVADGFFMNHNQLIQVNVNGSPLTETSAAAFRGIEILNLPPGFNVDSSGEWTP